MTVIFKNLNLKRVYSKILDNKIIKNVLNISTAKKVLIKSVAFVLIGVTAFGVSFASTGITLGFDVEFDGKIIATVKNEGIANTARAIVVRSVAGDADKAIPQASLKPTLTVQDKLETADKVADAIIENSCEIFSGAALVVDGEERAIYNYKKINSLLEARLTAYYVEGVENTSSFVADVQVKKGHFLCDDKSTSSEVEEAIQSLVVSTTYDITEDVFVPYETKKSYSNDYTRGYTKVVSAGVKGISRKTQTVKTIDGAEVARVVLEEQVMLEPVAREIIVGTAAATVSATERANAKSAGFIFPISKGKYTVTSYWGDGRGHKAIDLAADRGVAIFAVAGGTVVERTYASDYGYYVTIDHGNGIKTRYAHCNAFAVSKGQTVSQGDMIATVGNTGRSTGNHLHFEVIVNGTRVDPAPYIGLR